MSHRASSLSVPAIPALLVVAGFAFEATQPTRFGARVLALFASPGNSEDLWVGPDVIGNLPRDASGQLRIDAAPGASDRPMPAAIKQRLEELKAQRDRVYGSLRRGQFPTDPPDVPELELLRPSDLADFHLGIDR